jgi:hypothetical protein
MIWSLVTEAPLQHPDRQITKYQMTNSLCAASGMLPIRSTMRGIRRRLSWVIAGWLFVQLAGIAAPVALAAAQYVDELCICPAGHEGASCPMHHGRTPPPSESEPGRCHVRNTGAPPDATLLSIAGVVAVIVTVPASHVLVTSAMVSTSESPVLTRTGLLDPPPPRI